MRAGRLKERVTIQRAVETPDAGGGAAISWQDMAKVWASVEPLSGRDQVEGGGLVGVASYRVRMRRREGITSADRLVWRGVVLDIASPPLMDAKREMTQLLCVVQEAR